MFQTQKKMHYRDIYDSSVDSKVIVNAPTTLPAFTAAQQVNYCRYQYDLFIDFGSSSPLAAGKCRL